MSSAEMTELIEVAFGSWTHVGQRNHVLDRDQDPPPHAEHSGTRDPNAFQWGRKSAKIAPYHGWTRTPI